jgi:hypothetical protein
MHLRFLTIRVAYQLEVFLMPYNLNIRFWWHFNGLREKQAWSAVEIGIGKECNVRYGVENG